MVEGQYYPLRIIFAQAQGAATFGMNVTAPDGTAILDSNTQNSPYIVQNSCDGVTAPGYSPYGRET